MQTVAIHDLLASLGVQSDEAQRVARRLLEAEGLTQARKVNISADKEGRVSACLAERARLHCGDPACAALAARELPNRVSVEVIPSVCAICGGSRQRRAVRELIAGLLEAGCTRLLIVGGSAEQHRILHEIARGSGVDVRAIDGSRRAHSQREANPHVAWADVVVIWGSTPLHHKVSVVYERAPTSGRRVKVDRPGLEALCTTVLGALCRA